MNLGNTVDLFLLVIFVAPGAYLGQALVGGYGGAIVGAVFGILARIAVGLLAGRWPPCACGNAEVGRFDLIERTAGQRAWKCQSCGKSYVLQRRDWVEVLEDDTRVTRLRRGRLKGWKRVDEV